MLSKMQSHDFYGKHTQEKESRYLLYLWKKFSKGISSGPGLAHIWDE
jgi:hypothetical protein